MFTKNKNSAMLGFNSFIKSICNSIRLRAILFFYKYIAVFSKSISNISFSKLKIIFPN
jgi:hypothetical protein